jgi:hypothetical protein
MACENPVVGTTVGRPESPRRRRFRVWERVRQWESRHVLLGDALVVLSACASGVIWDNALGYAIGAVWAVRLAVDAARPRARSLGVPEWSASEAYITSWRRWRRSRRSDL